MNNKIIKIERPSKEHIEKMLKKASIVEKKQKNILSGIELKTEY